MKYRELGNSGIQASAVAFGAWAVGGGPWWGPTEDAESIRAIHAALDHGVTLVDTAPVYGFGRSEEVVGRAVADRRDKVVLATKCGLWWHDDRGGFYFKLKGTTVRRSLRPETIREEVEMSLRRLKTDVIDLYQTHWPILPPETTPIADTMGELMALRDAGKIRAIGCSNASPALMDEYRAAGVLATNQPRYNLLDREIEDDLLPYCREHGVGVLAYSPLEQGLLTGNIGMDKEYSPEQLRSRRPWFRPANRQRVLDMIAGWDDLRETYNCTTSQLVIAWTLAQPGLTHALCGARHPDHVIENAGGGELDLAPDDVDRIRQDAEALGQPL